MPATVEQGNGRNRPVGLHHVPSELVIGLGASGVLDNRFGERLKRPLGLVEMHVKIIHLAADLVAIFGNPDLRKEPGENLLAFVFQETVQTFDRVDIEAAIVGRPSC